MNSINCPNTLFPVSPSTASVAVGQSLTVTITFNPVEYGEKSTVIYVESDDNDEGSLTVNISGTGLAPEISLSSTAIALGDVNVGSSVNGMFSISNEGNSPLTVSSISSDNPVITVNPPSMTIEAGQSTPVTVIFSPVVMGEQSAVITIVSNDSDEGTLTVQVNGTGRATELSLSSTSLAFGNVDAGSSAADTFTISNNGNSPLSITSISSDNGVYTVNPPSATVNAGQSTTVTVTFSPVERGEQIAEITIVSDEKTLTVQVNGTGSAPEIALSTASISIGDVEVGSSGTGTFVITNEGNKTLEVSSINSSNIVFSMDTPSATIEPGGNRTVTVTFSPVTIGEQNAVISVTNDDTDEGTLNVNVSGKGLAPEITLSTTFLSIGDVDVGISGTGTFMITNEGNKPLTVNSISSDNGTFSVDQTSLTIEPDGNRIVTVSFTPEAMGEQTATVSVTSDDTDEGILTVSVSGNGMLAPEEVSFPDPNLEAAIRSTLGKPAGPITDEDLAKLTDLDASERGISDLTGIEHCVNLQNLVLHSNQISDLSPLINLTDLWSLNLVSNRISDLSPLSSLTNLQSLHFSGNQISDLSSLSGLTKLDFLSMSSNQINDLNPLVNLTNLILLYLGNNQIQDISPLAGLKMIGEWEIWEEWEIDEREGVKIHLGLSNNRISDITSLVSNTGIGAGDGIDLRGNLLSNEAYNNLIPAIQARGANVLFDPPKPVTISDPNLEAAIRDALNKPEGSINDKDLAGLTDLVASERDISDLNGIEYCVNLQMLYLDSNQISDISPLNSLTNLDELGLDDNQISDISQLSDLTNLWYLGLDDNQISDISPLNSLTNLVEMGLGNNRISDPSPLSNLTNLQRLHLVYNQISELSPLSSLTNLHWLFLGGNQISNLSPLSSLTNLENLSLYENQISDL
ncbi:choice-of-anchor D domain-containing protein, partial [Candidatus Latescibacterota bacterium]